MKEEHIKHIAKQLAGRIMTEEQIIKNTDWPLNVKSKAENKVKEDLYKLEELMKVIYKTVSTEGINSVWACSYIKERIEKLRE